MNFGHFLSKFQCFLLVIERERKPIHYQETNCIIIGKWRREEPKKHAAE